MSAASVSNISALFADPETLLDEGEPPVGHRQLMFEHLGPGLGCRLGRRGIFAPLLSLLATPIDNRAPERPGYRAHDRLR